MRKLFFIAAALATLTPTIYAQDQSVTDLMYMPTMGEFHYAANLGLESGEYTVTFPSSVNAVGTVTTYPIKYDFETSVTRLGLVARISTTTAAEKSSIGILL